MVFFILLETLQVLDRSRWNIFVFSKEALADDMFKHQFDAAINASINDDQMQVIPVLSKGLKLEDVPSYYKWVTLLSADEPGYIEKLWKVMNSKIALIRMIYLHFVFSTPALFV